MARVFAEGSLGTLVLRLDKSLEHDFRGRRKWQPRQFAVQHRDRCIQDVGHGILLLGSLALGAFAQTTQNVLGGGAGAAQLANVV